MQFKVHRLSLSGCMAFGINRYSIFDQRLAVFPGWLSGKLKPRHIHGATRPHRWSKTDT